MLSQFSDEGSGAATLAQLGFDFPKDVYPVGRLDKDSEGLLLLTNDRRLNAQLLLPEQHISKTYWAQVEGTATADHIAALLQGVTLRIDKKTYHCAAFQARILPEAPPLPPRIPPVRYRQSVPDSWIEMSLTEGKNRQVRRMTAAVGLPTLRLFRCAIGALRWEMLQGVVVAEIRQQDIVEKK